jgi:hypothetical protein
MFGDVALKLIKIMGHGGTVPGAIGADEVGFAAQRLQAAIEADKAASEGLTEQEQDEANGERRISLAQRALPLLELLQSAVRTGSPVMWSK